MTEAGSGVIIGYFKGLFFLYAQGNLLGCTVFTVAGMIGPLADHRGW
jgi:hypothetical protein